MALNYQALGKRIRHLRKRRGISQQALAEIIDCAPTYISYIEGGRKSMSMTTFVAIANALHATADELLVDSLENSIRIKSYEFSSLLSDCSDYEKKIMFAVLSSTKEALRTNDRPRVDK